MKRWQKLLVFIVALFVFSLFSWGMGKAASWWISVQVSVCGNICTKGGDLEGPVFWIQLIGLVLVSVCGIAWIVLPEEAEAAQK